MNEYTATRTAKGVDFTFPGRTFQGKPLVMSAGGSFTHAVVYGGAQAGITKHKTADSARKAAAKATDALDVIDLATV